MRILADTNVIIDALTSREPWNKSAEEIFLMAANHTIDVYKRQEIWPLFGSANQLLSVLALVACAVFLKKTKRQGCMLWILSLIHI